MLLSDADLSNPSISFHFGIRDVKFNINDVMLGRAKLADAIIKHSPTGLDILPGSLSGGGFVPTSEQIDRVGDVVTKMVTIQSFSTTVI